MDNTTSILDLPTDPVGGSNSSNNISMNAQENPAELQGVPQNQSGNSLNENNASSMSLDQTTINQIVSGLQQATISGSTQLPSRDIPTNTNNVSIDPEVVPNYVPPAPQNQADYIKDYEKNDTILHNYSKQKETAHSLDKLYDELHKPLLLAVLYFFFQLPFFKNTLHTYIPRLFSNDGNYNINGHLFTSLLFGTSFYVFMKIIFLDFM